MQTTPFTATSLLDRATSALAAVVISFSLLGAMGDIADHQLDNPLLAQADTSTLA